MHFCFCDIIFDMRDSSVFTDKEWEFAKAVSRFAFINPFDEQQARDSLVGLRQLDLSLGEIENSVPVRSVKDRPEIEPLVHKAESLTELTYSRLKDHPADDVREDVATFYCDLVMHTLYYRYRDEFQKILVKSGPKRTAACYDAFAADHAHYHHVVRDDFVIPADRMFACFFQIRRAYHYIRELVFGESRPLRDLRAAIWNSIFTRDFRLFGQVTYDRMHNITTLITGPSGTGKELVAQAIGHSRYIPFNIENKNFVEKFDGAFYPVVLSALSPTLIESELFGHCEGAFSGAVKDRVGRFGECKTFHTVFLDEIGELDEAIQVKLLRVLQSRKFERVGENTPKEFKGKVIAATNRNLAAAIDAGRFRADLYYRLCSDVITTPSLSEQLVEKPDELDAIVRKVCKDALGEFAGGYADRLAEDVLDYVRHSPQLGTRYRWPGNWRELQQCVRNILIRGEYHPTELGSHSGGTAPAKPTVRKPDPFRDLLDDVRYGRLTMEELLQHYCSLVHARTDNAAETARRLEKHQATVKKRIVAELVDRYSG